MYTRYNSSFEPVHMPSTKLFLMNMEYDILMYSIVMKVFFTHEKEGGEIPFVEFPCLSPNFPTLFLFPPLGIAGRRKEREAV